jgi:hypothetical protein
MSSNDYTQATDKYTTPDGLWGVAISYTRTDKEGKMWVGNGEYESQVNYCPVTGQMAPVQMKRVHTFIKSSDGLIKTITKYTNE